MENILVDKTSDLGTKHKNVRRLFARALKGMEKERGDILIYDFSYQFCESAEVKTALDDTSTPLLVDRSTNSTDNLAIYKNRAKLKNLQEIIQFIKETYQNNCSSTSLEELKRRILNEVEFENTPESENNAVGNKELIDDNSSQKTTQESLRSRSPAYLKFHSQHNLLHTKASLARYIF